MAIGVGLNWIELFILRPPEPESIYAVQYELYIAAIGVLYAAYVIADNDYVRLVAPPAVAVGGGVFATYLLMIFASPVQGLPIPAGLVHGTLLEDFFTIWLPDLIAVFVLFWAIVVARRIGLEH